MKRKYHIIPILFTILVILIAGIWVYFRYFSTPPVRTETSEDPKDYGKYNAYVKSVLKESFAHFLPQEIPEETTVQRYRYGYQCGFAGDPDFYILLQLKYDDSERFEKTAAQLRAASIQSAEEDVLLFLKGSIENVKCYFDDDPQDGKAYYFAVVQIEADQRQITYFAAKLYDAQIKSEVVRDFFRTILE